MIQMYTMHVGNDKVKLDRTAGDVHVDAAVALECLAGGAAKLIKTCNAPRT